MSKGKTDKIATFVFIIGQLIEQLPRKSNEENSVTEMEKYFTPHDYVELLAN